MGDATNLQIGEYKYLKESIFKAERTMQAVFIFSIITSFSLFSAMLTIVVKDDFREMDNLILPWVFLTPMVIIIPLFEMIKGQRDSIIRDAYFMQIISLGVGQSLTEVSFNFSRSIFLLVPLFVLGLLIFQTKSYKRSMKEKKDIYIENFQLVKEQLKAGSCL